MKISVRNVKTMILNSKMENYIMPLYLNFLYIKNILKGTLFLVRGSVVLRTRNQITKNKHTILQLPITNRCNLKCKMCNVPNIKDSDFDVEDLKKVIKNKSFKKIKSVGVNGGEPFLKTNIEEYVETLLLLPKLKEINIISNGILKNRILVKLETIYKMCKSKGVQLNVTFSIDGYSEKHDEIRGVEGSFNRTIETIELIQTNKDIYCDNLGVICTISKYNIYSLSELECYFKLYKLPEISYQLAVQHKRLNNKGFVEDYSIINDKHMKMIAREFFFTKFCETHRPRYYYIYMYIKNNFSNRMISCIYKKDALTIDASGNLCYCAVESDPIGSIRNGNDVYDQIFDAKNLEYRKKILDEKCDKCIHYSDSKPYFSSYLEMCRFELNQIKWTYRYLRLGGNLK